MSQKDFTDYNGKKRKLLLYPPPERPVLHGQKPKQWVSFKTKCDRYRAAVKHFQEWWTRKRRADYQRIKAGPDYAFKKQWYHDIVRDTIKKLRKLKTEYQAEGIFDRIKEAL